MKVWVLLIMGAVSPFLFSSTLSSTVALAFLLPVSLIALNPRFRLFCLFPVFFIATTLALNERTAARWPLLETSSVYEITGVVGSLPETTGDSIRFIFLPDSTIKAIPTKIRVYWYKGRHKRLGQDVLMPSVRAGQRWRLQLVLRAPRGRINFHGVDAERWYFTDGVGALAYVQAGENILLAGPGRFDLQHWREAVLDKLTEKAGDVPSFRMLAALAIADRRALLTSDRQILSATGTGHLLAISGLHVGLAAAMGFYLGRVVLLFLRLGFKQRCAVVLPWLTAWLIALVYTALSGFGVSTQRALIMLTVASVVMLSRRNVNPFLAWLIAMALVLAADPLAPLRAGFWFSFVAVAVLMMLFVPRHGQLPVWRKMLYAQLGISLVMAPLGMYWFQQASLPGMLANLIAIPVVSMVVVPLVIISLFLLWLPGPLVGWLLTVAGYATDWLFMLLDFLSGFQPLVLSSTRVPGLTATLLAMTGAAIILLPRGLPARLAGFLLMLPMMIPAGQPLARDEVRIEFMDVGQGLSVLLAEQNYLMVYDTGPGGGFIDGGGWDMVAGTIHPMIKATGQTPDLIIASHGDLDHAGGLNSLQAAYPHAQFLASLPEKREGVDPCRAFETWGSDNLEFEILHPSEGLPYLGNDSSCVISVNSPGLSLLLSGDISQAVEQRLVNRGLQRHSILTVPHHGSSTSSSQALIDTLKPSLALISAGTYNRFGFPRGDVIERYTKANIHTLNTAECGGIRVTGSSNGGVLVETARSARRAIWRWPAGQGCLGD